MSGAKIYGKEYDNFDGSNQTRLPNQSPSVCLAQKEDPNAFLPRQDVEMYPWHSFRTPACCCCCGLVFQLVLLASLGSLLYGLNVALLNTATKMINSEYLQCGRMDLSYNQYTNWSFEQCNNNTICKRDCAVYDDADDLNKITQIRCPGGYNDVGCDSVKWENALLACSVLIGAAVGATTGGIFMGWGRRTVLLGMNFVFVIGDIGEVCSNSFSALFWNRLVVGYAVGLVSVVCPTAMSEVTPAHLRGTYGVMHQLMVTVGILVAMIIGLPLVNPAEQADDWSPPVFQKFWWRFMLALALIPTVIMLYFYGFTYSFETPLCYVEKKRLRDASEMLKLLYEKEDVVEELQELVEGYEQGEQNKREGLTFSSAFADSEYRFLILYAMALSAFQQLGGVNVIMTSSSDMFKKAGMNGTMQTAMSIVMAAINVIMTFPTLCLIEMLGRRTLMLIGNIGQFIFLLPAAVSYWLEDHPDNPSKRTQALAILAILGFVVSFAVAYGPVLWVYLFEIFPLELKAVAASNCTTVNWIAAIVIVFVAVVLPNQISFTLFAVLQLIAVLIVFFGMRETKGRTLGDSPFISPNKKRQANYDLPA